MKRAVITGFGIISSIGNNKKEVLFSLKNGISGIEYSEELKNSGMKSNIWGSIKLDTYELVNRKNRRFMSDSSIYCYLSMMEAIKDSKLNLNDISNKRVGIIAGSGGGSPRNQVIGTDNMRLKGLNGVGPYMVTKSMASGISACLSIAFKIKGVSYSISSACATSAHCIGNAFELIQLGKQDIIFSGGGEELCWEMACEFDAMKALSRKYNNYPKKSSRAYDKDRDGFVISGGGGIIVIEELQHALSRKANIYGEIIGYGATSDGENMVLPSGEGAKRCMKLALKNANLNNVDYINTHGTSTYIGDIKEIKAIKSVFNKDIPFISSTKSMTGHSLGACGVHEIIYSLLMLNNNFIAPSINIDKIDDDINYTKIVTKFLKVKLKTIMSNSFGFGGTNASIIIKSL